MEEGMPIVIEKYDFRYIDKWKVKALFATFVPSQFQPNEQYRQFLTHCREFLIEPSMQIV